MSLVKTRNHSLARLVLAAAMFAPGVCQAGLFDCLSPSPTTFAPPSTAQRVAWMPAVASACDPCAAPQVTYVPEVKYRWKYSRISRTEYEPVAACDPCSGMPVTTYRPVEKKSLLPWLHREAYTTYRAVPAGYGAAPVSYLQSPACNPCATICDPCGGTSVGAAAIGSSCPSCVSGSTVISGGTTSDPGYSSGKTFDATPPAGAWSPSDSSGSDSRLKPAPDPATEGKPTGSSGGMPQLIIPTGRTASRGGVTTVAYIMPVSIHQVGNLYESATAVPAPLRLVPVAPE